MLVSLAYFTTIQYFYYLACKPDNPCMNEGTCTDDETDSEKFKCTCEGVFTGATCETSGNTTI